MGLQFFYNLLNAGKTLGSDPVLHSLWIGGGVKLPTGTYDPEQKDDSNQSANTFQLGTGTVDFMVNLMYDLRIRKVTIAPNTGIAYETASRDNYNKFFVDASGGNILSQTTGVEISFKNIAAGASWQAPLEQHLANNLVKAGNRAMVHISFML